MQESNCLAIWRKPRKNRKGKPTFIGNTIWLRESSIKKVKKSEKKLKKSDKRQLRSDIVIFDFLADWSKKIDLNTEKAKEHCIKVSGHRLYKS